MKILVAYRQIHNTAGGVERMASLIMNEMVRRDHAVEYLTLDNIDAVSFYPLDPKIVWHRLAIGNPARKADFSIRLKRILATRNIIRKFQPDVILAFQEASFLSARLAVTGLHIPVIAAERNSPSRFNYMNPLKRHLAMLSFFFAKHVTIQCDSFRKSYPQNLQRKIETIPNPVFAITTSLTQKNDLILSVGRLEYQKNFSALIAAFASIANLYPSWKLTIVGEGEDRMRLENVIRNKGLEDRVHLPGTSGDLAFEYQSAKIFCLPSRWEGFPNTLAEALSYGLPSVGFADCDGVSDLIQDKRNGLLAAGNDAPETLAEALSKLMSDEKLRDEMSQAAVESVTKFEPSTIFDRWERLLRAAGEQNKT